MGVGKLRPENVIKKIDNLGRVTLPKGLRNRLMLNAGSEVELFVLEQNDDVYICLKVLGAEPEV